MTAEILARVFIAVAIAVSRWVVQTNNEQSIGVVLTYEIDQHAAQTGGTKPDMSTLVRNLNGRLAQVGRAHALDNKRLAVDIYGEPKATDLEWIKRLVSGMGHIEFRILADPANPKDQIDN